MFHWNSIENRKKFLDEVAVKLQIQEPKEWGKVTLRQFEKLGGISLLRFYRKSLFLCLKDIYKGFIVAIDWLTVKTLSGRESGSLISEKTTKCQNPSGKY